jgi:hypothetical protein
MTRRRYLHSFESLDGVLSFEFPAERYEWDTGGDRLRSPKSVMSGASWQFRHLGNRRGLKDSATERVRCIAHGTAQEQDDIVRASRGILHRIGYGRLWFKSYVEDEHSAELVETMEWSLGELAEMPQFSVSYQSRGTLPIIFGFDRNEDLYQGDQIDVTQHITADGQTFQVINPGVDVAMRCIIEVSSLSAAGFNHFKITNQTLADNGFGKLINYEFECLRAATSDDDVVRLSTIDPYVRFTTDGFTTYVSDFGNYPRPPAAQARYSFGLAGGVNTLRVDSDGTVNCNVRVIADAPAD